jgi:hypothetical protein
MNDYDRVEFERVKRQAALYGEDSLNDLDKWRLHRSRDEDERDKERVRARQIEQSEVEQLRAEMQRELAALRAEMVERHEAALEAAGEVVGQYADKTFELAERTIKAVRDLLTVTIERRFGELMGRIDAMLPDHRSQSRSEKRFEFASEKDDSDLLNDLPSPGEIVRKPRAN